MEQATKVIRAIFDAARRFEAYQLPEIFAGLSRKDVEDFPALYPPGANIPQELQQRGHVQGKVVLRVA